MSCGSHFVLNSVLSSSVLALKGAVVVLCHGRQVGCDVCSLQPCTSDFGMVLCLGPGLLSHSVCFL